MSQGLVTVFGGSGFLGRYLVKRLAAQGGPVRVAVRDPEAGLFLKPMGAVGQIELIQANVRDHDSVGRAVNGADSVVNLVGTLIQSRRQSFTSVHAQGPERIAMACAATRVSRLIHVSAVGPDAHSASQYFQSKADGESRVHAAFPNATLVRPSVVFGPEDGFFNRLAAQATWLPFMAIFGGTQGAKFQPVYVGDVADALMTMLGDGSTRGKTYELGGPQVVTMRQILERIIVDTGRKRMLIPAPNWVGTVWAWKSAVLPFPSALNINRDQLIQLGLDNVVADGAKTLADLGIAPTPLAAVVPGYLARYRSSSVPGGQATEPGPQ
jgi:NADH dehydrogenase